MRRFGQVTQRLFRSGKYQMRELQSCIEQYGIQRIIDLRDRPPLFAERTYARFRVERLSYPLCEYAPIGPQQCLDILTLLESAVPTLIHCWKGSHRTGAVIAAYRLHVQRWTHLRTWQEMQHYDFGEPAKHEALFASIFGEWRP